VIDCLSGEPLASTVLSDEVSETGVTEVMLVTDSRPSSRLPTLKMVFKVSLLCCGFRASRAVEMGNNPVCSRSFVSTS
jgi:hypothetical protein